MVVAGNPEAIKEVLVTKSGDYAGRPQTYINFVTTSGKDFLIEVCLPSQKTIKKRSSEAFAHLVIFSNLLDIFDNHTILLF